MSVFELKEETIVSEELNTVRFADITRVRTLLEEILASPEEIRKHRSRLRFEVKGIGGQVDALLADHGVRRWFALLDQEFPFLPYFCKPGRGQFRLLAWSVIDPNAPGGIEAFVRAKALAVAGFCRAHGDDPGDILSNMAAEVRTPLDAEFLRGLRDEGNREGEGLVLGDEHQYAAEEVADEYLRRHFLQSGDIHVLSPQGDSVAMVLMDDISELTRGGLGVRIDLASLPSAPVVVVEHTVPLADGPARRVQHCYDVTEEADARELMAMVEKGFQDVYFFYWDEGRLMSSHRLKVILGADLREILVQTLFRAQELVEVMSADQYDFALAAGQLRTAGEAAAGTPSAG